MSGFADLPDHAPDAAFALIEQYRADSAVVKVDLSPGFYRDEAAEPWVLPSVQAVSCFTISQSCSADVAKAKNALSESSGNDHEHLPLVGHPGLLHEARDLVFDVSSAEARTIASIQTIAGTGANHLGALLMAQVGPRRTVWISDPSWINHQEIWKLADSGIQRRTYPYFDADTFSVDFNGTLSTLETYAVKGDVVVLHGCAHNPTGIDFTKAQWQEIADVCDRKRLIPFFDLAYQGFATGDLADDAWAIRHFFHNTSLELLVAQSFSKNFGLYGERVGALHVVCRTEAVQKKTLGMLTRLSRAEITSAPIHGARIVAKVLGDEMLKKQWLSDLAHMSGRMQLMRRELVRELRKRGA
ncbi:hypothetical protein D0865_00523 [Hortaea werneckii]|uniref:Aspartate aminotransferase n=1 Tax=Hortaea werneckii TaxID=91943 RepID=A0A3M7DE89_HORWE|nr:hypothetical protein D0865_00523 [Hortaea werneckii]